MSWSQIFINGLAKKARTPIFELRFLNLNNSIGSTYILSSFDQAPLKISRDGVSVSGVSVIPSRWSVSFGGFSVSVVGDPQELFLNVRRGSFAELYCKIDTSRFERIAIGQLHTITRSGLEKKYILQFKDIVSALQNRTASSVGAFPTPTVSNPPEQDLFFENGITFQLSQTWNVGDNFMYFNNVDLFRRESGQNGIVKVQASTGSSPFYLEFSAVDAGNLRIDTSPNSGNEAFPSEIAAYSLPTATGSFATISVQIDDHPSSLLGKIINSTGNGTSGSFDTLPLEWSVGGQFSTALFDDVDSQIYQQNIRSRTSTNYSWRYVSSSPQSNGIRDLVNLFSPFGQFPVMRQGKITWRGCTDPTGDSLSYSPKVSGFIREHDIISILKHELFDPSSQQVYPISSITYTTQTAPINTTAKTRSFPSSRVSSFPSSREINRESQFLYSPDEDQEDMANGDLDRLLVWDHYTWQKIQLRCTIQTSQFVAGDVVELTTRFISSIGDFGRTFNSKRALVLSSSFDFRSNTSIIDLGIPNAR